MRRGLWTVAAAGCLAAAMTMTSFAAEWKQDQVGWWYQNDDGSYLKDGWSWVDGRCYYFDGNGYCLLNTTTPDGYTVDASGAWTVDGVVQTQSGTVTGQSSESQSSDSQKADVQTTGEEVSVAGLTFKTPAGFGYEDALSDDSSKFFSDDNGEMLIAVVSEAIPDMEGYESLADSMSEGILDLSMDMMGTVQEKSTHQFNSGTWYKYRFTDADAAAMGIPGQLYIYGRISGGNVQMVMFMGETSGADMNGIMNSCVK
ncbi:MAG: hypothetical protein Q4F28_05040 [Eubacteriales bacterium]|nr:hypothetical protein [Eubacteriales bacterium]